MRSIRVVVADDHPLMLTAVASRLAAEDDIDVVATAKSCGALAAAIALHKPDVALIDLTMPDGSTLDGLEALLKASPRTRVLLLSATDNSSDVTTALERGAAGFLSKDVDPDDVPKHVRAVAAGTTVLDARSTAAVAAQLRQPSVDDLTPRELDVLGLVAAGRSNREIGTELFVSVSTVKTHLERVFAKLDVSDRAAAVARAKDRRLL